MPGLSVATGLPHDIMHNLYEGVVKLELKLFLAYCIGKKYFTIDELNRKICYYDFKSNEYKIRQSASQMINLSKEFSMLIGDKISMTNIITLSYSYLKSLQLLCHLVLALIHCLICAFLLRKKLNFLTISIPLFQLFL